MPVFFVPPDHIAPTAITISGDLLIHLRDSLRIAVGETVCVSDGAGHRYRAEITAITKNMMSGRIIEAQTQPPRRTPALVLAQALLKGEKMDWVIQKATELGVRTIVPLEAARSVVHLRPDRLAAQSARWRRIALEAAQQSEQWVVPTIARPQSLQEICSVPEPAMVSLFLAERCDGAGLGDIPLPSGANATILLLIGPEGGWTKEETQIAEQAGCKPITLGSSILRAETAALAAISILQSRLGNLG
ncbi:MAG: 16S rRNA (uracil(1498)-N(3))-methyltransferase [Nitrospira sp.]|nr:16S rRNA (uracil(1498)-N(3))-methyltransferase [Nitrospira sp.]MCP9462095.1 16S rRNA (uracil(1498)-N(3))-methyltransferase [Nitrospira sp.]MCP9475158.1 16S rRNA (uracil(1498)-N(3))-methyltransferase [Nitrospira sp.]